MVLPIHAHGLLQKGRAEGAGSLQHAQQAIVSAHVGEDWIQLIQMVQRDEWRARVRAEQTTDVTDKVL